MRNKIKDPFWSHYVDLVRTVVVPYQWEALNDRIEGLNPAGPSVIFALLRVKKRESTMAWYFRTVM